MLCICHMVGEILGIRSEAAPRLCISSGRTCLHRCFGAVSPDCWVCQGGGVPLQLAIGVTALSSENAMAPHSSTLAWKVPWTEKPGRLQSIGLLRVRYDWETSLSLFTFMHWTRKWQPTPVFLPGESQGRGSLVGCRLWGHTESDTTEAT